MHRKEYQIMYAVRKARELRRLKKLISPKYKVGEQIEINFLSTKVAQ